MPPSWDGEDTRFTLPTYLEQLKSWMANCGIPEDQQGLRIRGSMSGMLQTLVDELGQEVILGDHPEDIIEFL